MVRQRRKRDVVFTHQTLLLQPGHERPNPVELDQKVEHRTRRYCQQNCEITPDDWKSDESHAGHKSTWRCEFSKNDSFEQSNCGVELSSPARKKKKSVKKAWTKTGVGGPTQLSLMSFQICSLQILRLQPHALRYSNTEGSIVLCARGVSRRYPLQVFLKLVASTSISILNSQNKQVP